MNASVPTAQATLDAIDDLYCRVACARARSDAISAAERFRDAYQLIDTLSRRPEIAAAPRVQYRHMVRAMTALQLPFEKVLAGAKRFPGSSFGRDDYLLPKELLPDAQTVHEIRRIIRTINAAEQSFMEAVEHARQAAQASDKAGWINWNGLDFWLDLSVELELPPERTFYESCLDGEALGIPVEGYMINLGNRQPKRNWNMFIIDPQNPFYSDHHGYLVHCLIGHSELPLALFPLIRSIEVQLKFTDYRILWRRVPYVVNGDE